MHGLKKYHVSKQNLPSRESFDLELNGTPLDPIMIDNLLAPLTLIELSICNCKGGCSFRLLKVHLYVLICVNVPHAIIATLSKTATRKYLNMINQMLKIMHDIHYLASLIYKPSQICLELA